MSNRQQMEQEEQLHNERKQLAQREIRDIQEARENLRKVSTLDDRW